MEFPTDIIDIVVFSSPGLLIILDFRQAEESNIAFPCSSWANNHTVYLSERIFSPSLGIFQ